MNIPNYMNIFKHRKGDDIFIVDLDFNSKKSIIQRKSTISILYTKVRDIYGESIQYRFPHNFNHNVIMYAKSNMVFDNLVDAERLVARIIIGKNKMDEFPSYNNFDITDIQRDIIFAVFSETNPEWVI